MGSLFREDFRSESFPNCDRKFVDRRDARYERDARPAGNPNIKFLSPAVIGNFPNAFGNARGALGFLPAFRLIDAQEGFGQRVCCKRPRPELGSQVALSVKLREREVYGQSRDSEIRGQSSRGREPRGLVAKASRSQFITDLTIELLVERFDRSPVQSNHFESYDRAPTPLFAVRFPRSGPHSRTGMPIPFEVDIAALSQSRKTC